MSLHLEISEDAYWALTAIAAEDRMHIEEWLESYLDEHCLQPIECYDDGTLPSPIG